jgi:hypothetical protein
MHVSDDERVAAHDEPPEPAAQSPRARIRAETDESTQNSRLVLARCAARTLSAGSRLCRPLRAARASRQGSRRGRSAPASTACAACCGPSTSRMDRLVPAGRAAAVSGSMISRTRQCCSRWAWCTHSGHPDLPLAQYRPGFAHQPIIERPFDGDNDQAQAGAGCARLGLTYLMAGSGSASCCRTRRWACPSNRRPAERVSSWGRTRSRR